jgi:hypothetical protein
MKIERPVPSEGQWFKRTNKGGGGLADRYKNAPTDLVQIGAIDHERREFEVFRVDGFTATGTLIIGRRTKISFATWQDEGARRYEPTEPPALPKSEPEPVVAPQAEPEEPAPVSGIVATVPDIEARLRAIESQCAEILALVRRSADGPLFGKVGR